MTDTFEAQVGAWTAKADARISAVFKASAQDVISEMQEVGPSVANPDSFGSGHMPVDTGFLRASLQAALNEPSAQQIVFRPPADASMRYDPSPVALVIASAKPGDTVYATYGAAYGPAMNDRYEFVGLAAQKWQQIVSRNAREAQRQVQSGSAAPS